MPDDVAEEKVKALEALGATVERVRPASIVDKKQVRLGLLHLGLYFADIPCNAVCREHAFSSGVTIVFQLEGPSRILLDNEPASLASLTASIQAIQPQKQPILIFSTPLLTLFLLPQHRCTSDLIVMIGQRLPAWTCLNPEVISQINLRWIYIFNYQSYIVGRWPLLEQKQFWRPLSGNWSWNLETDQRARGCLYRWGRYAPVGSPVNLYLSWTNV